MIWQSATGCKKHICKQVNCLSWQYYISARWSNVLCPTQNKIGQFGDVLLSQSLGTVLKKPNPTKLMTQSENDVH